MAELTLQKQIFHFVFPVPLFTSFFLFQHLFVLLLTYKICFVCVCVLGMWLINY